MRLVCLGAAVAAVSVAPIAQAGDDGVTPIPGPYYEDCPNGVDTDGVALQGDSSNNSITGTPNDDLLKGGAGNDDLFGLSGDDCLAGQPDDDEEFGADGDDRVRGGKNDDKLFGDDDVDNVGGGKGDDKVHGGAKGDVLRCGKGHDVAFKQGPDTIKKNCEVVKPE